MAGEKTGEDDDTDVMGLSAEELAAIADDEDDETASLTEIAGEAQADASAGDQAAAGEDDDPDEDDPAAAPAAAPATAPAPAPAPATPAADDAADDEDDEPAPTLPLMPVELPADAPEKLKALRQEKRDLFAKYNAGEIDETQYQEQSEAKEDEISDLRGKMQQAEWNKGIEIANKQAETSAWYGRVNKFFDQVKTEGIDYRNNVPLGAAMDATVKALGNEKDANGNLVNANRPQSWFLKEAHKRVKEAFNIKGTAAPSPTPAPPAPAPAPAAGKPGSRAGKAPDLSNVPPSIARAPAAATQGEGAGSEFAHLDSLTGMELEKAVARMTPEQQDRYAQES